MQATPWIELAQTTENWQAVFACQICTKLFSELQAGRWGFNAQALLTEALDRQKLFVESQHEGSVLEAAPENQRTVAFRIIQIPEKGVQLALIGKVCAASKPDAAQRALEYCQELVSVFPSDYRIFPACSRETFESLLGRAIIEQCNAPAQLGQILRVETSVRAKLYVYGCWQNGDRSDEQIWRTLGNYPHPVLLNISLRSTQLEFVERQILFDMSQQPIQSEGPTATHAAQPLEKWAEPLITRRLPLWKRFYYLQVHLACPETVTDSLTRPIGSAITRETPDPVSPGFTVRQPATNAQIQEWQKSLLWLDVLPSEINLSALSRLSDLADLNEAHAVFRFPYPPEPGLPGVTFIDKLE